MLLEENVVPVSVRFVKKCTGRRRRRTGSARRRRGQRKETSSSQSAVTPALKSSAELIPARPWYQRRIARMKMVRISALCEGLPTGPSFPRISQWSATPPPQSRNSSRAPSSSSPHIHPLSSHRRTNATTSAHSSRTRTHDRMPRFLASRNDDVDGLSHLATLHAAVSDAGQQGAQSNAPRTRIPQQDTVRLLGFYRRSEGMQPRAGRL